MSQKTKVTAGDRAGAVFLGLVFAFWGAVAVPFGWVVVAVAGWGFGFDLSASAFVPTLIVAAVVAFFIGLLMTLGQEQERVNGNLREIARETAQAASERGQRRDQVKRDTERNAADATAEFCSLAGMARTACDFGAEARAHYTKGAYSPFWAAIENAFVTLADSNRVMAGIQARSGRHTSLVAEYRRLDGGGPVTTFPDLAGPVKRAGQSGEAIATSLRELAYEAQRDAVFAQIWEQRRTTAAVVSGFRSMEQAISQLGSTIMTTAGDLERAIRASGSSVGSALGAAAAASSASQLAGQELVAKKVSDAVWLLDDQRKRALGWR